MAVQECHGTLGKNLKAVYSLIYSSKRERSSDVSFLVAWLADRPRRKRSGKEGTEVDIVITHRELERSWSNPRSKEESRILFPMPLVCQSYISSRCSVFLFRRGFDLLMLHLVLGGADGRTCVAAGIFFEPPQKC